MGGKPRGTPENSKKAAGQARKAEAAAGKKAAKGREVEAAEAAKWEKGVRDSSKKEAAAAKSAELAKKKAERLALEQEEMASLKTAKTGNAKSAQKKTAAAPSRGLDLSQLDSPSLALNASGIDNALDALDITSGGSNDTLDRHPERRFKAAYTAFEARRLEEMMDDKGLRRQQKIEVIRKEFEKHPDNPFNRVNASYNMSRAEMAALRQGERDSVEERLVGST